MQSEIIVYKSEYDTTDNGSEWGYLYLRRSRCVQRVRGVVR